MFLLEIFFVLAVILFIITVVFYISRIREYSSVKSQYLIPSFIISLYTFFFVNFRSLTLDGMRESFKAILFSSLSQLFLLFSTFIFFKSFFLLKDKILLEPPSRFSSRAGSILMGKVLKYDRKKHKFLLPLKDLGRHMFVCGITGSGKSNFLQYFLTNFKKKYDIPFLLVDFKGEYIFLQDVIEDLIIIRPGENFS